MRGALPKAAGQRRNRAAILGMQVAPRTGELHGPTLEAATSVDVWGPQTRAWWHTWREAPQAALFEGTDWSRLAMVAALVEHYWQTPDARILTEIRQNEERLGALVKDRLASRIAITEHDPEEAPEPSSAPVADISAYRSDIDARVMGGAD